VNRHSLRRLGPLALLALCLTGCTGQAQLIDAGTDGASAFIAFTVMVFIFTAFLFSLDRFRKNRE
jgi:hypothetical protein